MEQILAQLVAEMKAMRENMDSNEEKMKSNQARMEAKIWAEIETIQDKMDDGKEIKGQVGSLAFRIDANREEMNSGCLSKEDGGKSRRIAVHSGVSEGP
jgi:hypothetical protein